MTIPDDALKPTLDGLLSDTLPVSPPQEVEIGTATLTIAWKALSREQMQFIQLRARKWAHAEVKKGGLPPEDVDSVFMLDLVTNELELRLLHASMVDPHSEGGLGPALSLEKLRKNIKPGQQSKLNEQWFIWQSAHDHEDLSKEQIDEMIEAAQRGDYPFLIKFGSGGLLTCITSLVAQLETAQTDRSWDGLSSEVESSDTSSEPEKAATDNNYSALLGRLSALEVRIERNKSRIDDTRAEMDRKLRAK
jgi:hypothetical protein